MPAPYSPIGGHGRIATKSSKDKQHMDWSVNLHKDIDVQFIMDHRSQMTLSVFFFNIVLPIPCKLTFLIFSVGAESRLSFDGKTEPSSPIEKDRIGDKRDTPFSRCSSTSSIHTLSSSAQNTGNWLYDSKLHSNYSNFITFSRWWRQWL